MIDIHNHILPGVDDGAQTERDSIDMAKAAVEEGIHTIVATPHHKNRTYDNYKREIIYQVSVLNELMDANNLPLRIIPGQEIRIYGELLEDYANGEILPVNQTKYVLVEFPSSSVPRFADQLFYDMQLEGLIPVIVHPERNRELLEHPSRMYELIRNGALSQITAGSLVGQFGKQMEQYSHQLIEANLTHFIASDAHDTVNRPFHMQESFSIVQKEYGVDTYFQLVENSELLIDNQNVNRMEPLMPKKKRKKFFGLF
ncbi:MAG TPA: CpsB/CapC family capsule biosynthesis tyrosine phosphatase [Pseudogracilibacillus sp.]|nr:CpsB/CapC family capsule biosynthesis tyrosine phosphatase [Pseudogracilibacillus sp.]